MTDHLKAIDGNVFAWLCDQEREEEARAERVHRRSRPTTKKGGEEAGTEGERGTPEDEIT